jgi:hypothetical protein
MCIFSGSVDSVSKTSIFARWTAPGRQLLVYSMSVAATSDVAMVLPLPVPVGSGEDAISFVDLSASPTFFEQLAALFPVSRAPRPQSPSLSASPSAALAVHAVGDFEASFVPGASDFDRLDPRFRLSDGVLAALPAYADWGFCVFKLRAASAGGGGRERTYHPMALKLPMRDPSRLFFPTVHVHDGAVHAEATYDHVLYAQTPAALGEAVRLEGDDGPWARSPTTVACAAAAARKGGASPITTALPWLDPGARVQRWELRGESPNVDVYAHVAG